MSDPASLPSASRGELARWVFRRRARFRVSGASMEPTLHDGDVVLLDKRRQHRIGDVVVAVHPRRSGLKIVKRLTGGSPDDGWVLGSDNRSETDAQDSRTFGPVGRGAIVGTVTAVVR